MRNKGDDLLSTSIVDSIILNRKSLRYWFRHPMSFSLYCVELIFGIIGGFVGLIFDNILCLIVGLIIGVPVGICAGLKVKRLMKKD